MQNNKRQRYIPFNLIIGFLVLMSYFCIHRIQPSLSKPILSLSAQEQQLNINGSFLKVMNLGLKRMASSLLWIHTLIEGDLEHYEKDDLNSWMYHRFDTITELDPYFYEGYFFGGVYLSIIKDDVYGADKIYKKGLKYFEDDFWLNYSIGFNTYFEMNKPLEAYKYYYKIQYHPIAIKQFPYLPSLTAKIKSQEGDLNTAYELMLIAYKNANNEKFKERFKSSLYALRTEIDLNCLNSKKNHACNRVDLEGKKYIQSESIWKAPKKWKAFRPFQRDKKKKD